MGYTPSPTTKVSGQLTGSWSVRDTCVDNGGQGNGRHRKNIEADLQSYLRVIDHGLNKRSECTSWTNRGITLEEATIMRYLNRGSLEFCLFAHSLLSTSTSGAINFPFIILMRIHRDFTTRN